MKHFELVRNYLCDGDGTINSLIACVTLLPSGLTNFVGLKILAGPQAYPPGASKVKFLGSLTVVLVVPAAPTESWNPLTALVDPFLPQELRIPPLQQFSTCWL